MASGSSGQRADNCSMCWRSFTGREPKRLPCSHTFCLPCLRDLQRAAMQQLSLKVKTRADDVDDTGGNKYTLTFPCPACHRVISVPFGGVSKLQTVHFIGHDDRHLPTSRQLSCEGCMQAYKARFSFPDCGKNVYHWCLRYYQYHESEDSDL